MTETILMLLALRGGRNVEPGPDQVRRRLLIVRIGVRVLNSSALLVLLCRRRIRVMVDVVRG